MQFGLSSGLYAAALAHHQAGRFKDAEAGYRQALAADPRHYESLHMLGALAGQLGQHDTALELTDRALALKPDVAEAHTNRGIALQGLGRVEEAIAAFNKAVALKPAYAEGHCGLANVLREQGRWEAAAVAYRQAIALKPAYPEALTNLGIALQAQEKLDEAEEAYERALQIAPGYALIHYNLGITLHHQGRVEDAAARFQSALNIAPNYILAHSVALQVMAYRLQFSAGAIRDSHRLWDQLHAASLEPADPVYANTRDPDRPLRIGYVSGDFQTHPVGYFLTKILAAHDRSKVEVYCYSTNAYADLMTARLQDSAAAWRDVTGLSDEALAAGIAKDRIDILVDLSGHTDHNRLLTFARKPAPVQASWLGYHGTTGLSAIDYLIMDPVAVPEGEEQWATEAVVRLPHGRFCYDPPTYAPDVATRPDGPVVFGSFNNLAKVRPEVIQLWAQVLKAVPDSRLVLKWKALSQPSVRERITEAFAAHGITADRLDLRPKTPHAQMLAEYGDIDIALDPFPFSGGLTSCEALWMGVPVVTMPWDRPVSRQTAEFLNALGLDGELAADSPEDYIRIGTALAADPARRAELRETLRERMAASPLCNGPLIAGDLEAAYRQMWRRWCAGEPATTLNV